MGRKSAFHRKITVQSVQNQILKEMDRFIIKGRERYIRPIRKHCSCGKRVLNHHKYCQKCWEVHKQLMRAKQIQVENM